MGKSIGKNGDSNVVDIVSGIDLDLTLDDLQQKRIITLAHCSTDGLLGYSRVSVETAFRRVAKIFTLAPDVSREDAEMKAELLVQQALDTPNAMIKLTHQWIDVALTVSTWEELLEADKIRPK